MSTTIPHSKAPLGHVHPIVNWEFASAAELDAFAGITSADFHKVAYVHETQLYYTPIAVDAGTGEVTWTQLNGTGGGGGGSSPTNISVVQNATTAVVASSTGSDGTITEATSSIAGLMLPAQVDKLATIPVNLTEFTQDTVASFLVAGSNISLTYNDTGNSLTIASTASGGATNLSYTASPSNGTVVSDTGTDATVPLVDAVNAGLMGPSQHTKLAGIASGATANSSDAFLLDRANHTGTQAQSTIVNLTTDLAGKQATLVSGTNIKTVNGNSLLGSGDLTISGGGGTTDLGLGTITSSTVQITSSTGAAVVIPTATTTTAGVMSQAQLLSLQGKQDQLPNFTTQRILFGNGTGVPVTSANLTYNSSTDILTLGASAMLIWNAATADTIAGWNGSKQLVSLATGTYPSLTELARVKGVSSPIQSQLDAKIAGVEVVKNSGTIVGTRKQLNFIEGTNVTLTVADDAGNNQVDITIAATGGGGGATNLSYTASPTNGVVESDTGTDATIPLATTTNAGLLSPSDKTKLNSLGGNNFFRNAYYAEDFFNNNNTTLGPWQAAAISGGTWTTSPSTGDVSSNRPGVVFMRSSTTASSGYRLSTNSYAINLGNGEEANFIININSASSLSKTRIGFQDSFTPTDPGDGAVFNVNSDNTLSAVCWNNGSSTTATFANIDKTLWYRFHIRVESSSAAVFSVYLMDGTLVETQTIVSNIPTDSARVTGHGIVCWNTGTAVQDICKADYMDMYFPSRLRG